MQPVAQPARSRPLGSPARLPRGLEGAQPREQGWLAPGRAGRAPRSCPPCGPYRPWPTASSAGGSWRPTRLPPSRVAASGRMALGHAALARIGADRGSSRGLGCTNESSCRGIVPRALRFWRAWRSGCAGCNDLGFPRNSACRGSTPCSFSVPVHSAWAVQANETSRHSAWATAWPYDRLAPPHLPRHGRTCAYLRSEGCRLCFRVSERGSCLRRVAKAARNGTEVRDRAMDDKGDHILAGSGPLRPSVVEDQGVFLGECWKIDLHRRCPDFREPHPLAPFAPATRQGEEVREGVRDSGS